MTPQITAKARHPIWMALCLGAVLLPWAIRAEEAKNEAAQVSIDNFAFTPATLTVKAGTNVTFVNHDDIPHSVVGGDGTFRSKALDTDDRFAFTFTTPGEFGYFCGLHPHMIGKIVVVP
jgi:plastocyanin